MEIKPKVQYSGVASWCMSHISIGVTRVRHIEKCVNTTSVIRGLASHSLMAYHLKP